MPVFVPQPPVRTDIAFGADLPVLVEGGKVEDLDARPRTLALLSECMTLEPGDVVVMGTPAGVGYARNPPVWMKAGDTIEIEIEGIGVLANPVVGA